VAGAGVKLLNKRIRSVKNTQQITKAMKMVAAAKLRRSQDAAVQARPYVERLEELLHHVAAARSGGMAHPLLAVREEERCVDLVVVTADRGLCGGFNANLVRKALEFFREHEGVHVRLTLVGRKGYDSLKRRPLDIVEKHEGLPGLDLAAQIAGRLADDFTSGRTDGAYLIYSHFRSTLSQMPTVQRLLPVSGTSDTEEAQGEYLYEPGPGAVLDQLLFRYVTAVVGHSFLESIASEHGARMTAMSSATSNASEMIDRLTLEMNRARQAAITKELMEIVGGAEALKG